MKALTITQPWATLIAIGAKRFETRSWSTAYRGPLLIHAGKGLGPVGGMRGLRALCATEPFRSVLTDYELIDFSDPAGLPRGIIVAEARLVNCQKVDGLPPVGSSFRERYFGDYTAGRFAWELDDVRLHYSSGPVRGALGLWAAPCMSTNPFAAAVCEKPTGHDGLHEADGREWNWGDS